jgi:hypothetical protein
MNASEYWTFTKLRQLACLALALVSPVAWAEPSVPEQQQYFHGFASVGYIATTGNNFYGNTLDGGDVDYYEAGLNGFAQLHPNLSVSGQILSRKAGATDDGKLRLDYAFADFRLTSRNASNIGLRVGRVRNPLGFYNESRDVIFTRPSILLPQSTYLEANGVRELLFASDGIQLYGDLDWVTSHTTFKLNLARDEMLSRQTRENLANGLPGASFDSVKLKTPVFAQIMHEMNGGRERFALSYVDASYDGTITAIKVFPFSQESQEYVLSGQYNAENWSLTSEYSLTSTKNQISIFSSRGRSDGLYLQLQYRFTPAWTGLLRQDVFYADRNDRSANVSRDTTVGLSWAFRPEWLLSTEYHRIYGTAGIPGIDNPETASHLSQETRLLSVLLGYRF